ncbi:MAG TPA: hypothetical protein V6D22_22670 [Candidatus Obscuribacterales bacterium]
MNSKNSTIGFSLCLVVVSTLLVACGGNLAHKLPVRPSVMQLRNGDCEAINDNHPGEQLDVTRHLRRGKYTVVEFTSDY